MTLPLVLVVAVADNGVIGREGGLPWRLKSDLAHFRKVTIGHPVVMGRKTYLAIAKPLPGRTNIVVTRDPSFTARGVIVAHDLAAAFEVAQGDALRRGAPAIMVIGGADIYAQTMAAASRIELTRVHESPEGEAVFPPVDPAVWHEVARTKHAAGPGDDGPFTIHAYSRR